MSAAQHQATATSVEAAAQGHQEQYDPRAAKDSTVCGQATTVRPATQDGPPCWTSRTNPTTKHAEDADRLRALAAKHRAASSALVQAEQQACSGIDEDDRDMSPFYHREDLASVEPITAGAPYSGNDSSGKVTGARITFRPVPGLTREWLQHAVNCHLARAAAAGHDMPEMSYCPLVLKDVQAAVSSTGDALTVSVTSSDAAAAQEILRRAQALRSASPNPS